jgi:hypothetical protein
VCCTTEVRGRRGGGQSLADCSRSQPMTKRIPSLLPSPSPISTSCSEGSPFHRAIIAVMLGTLTTSDLMCCEVLRTVGGVLMQQHAAPAFSGP